MKLIILLLVTIYLVLVKAGSKLEPFERRTQSPEAELIPKNPNVAPIQPVNILTAPNIKRGCNPGERMDRNGICRRILQ